MIGPQAADTLMRRILPKAALYAEGQARREAPVRTGTLRRSITNAPETGGLRYRVGSNLRYAEYVERGTGPHEIRPKRGRYLVYRWHGSLHYSKLVHHPGTKPNPFLGRALAATAQVVPAIVRGEINQSLSLGGEL